MGRSLASRLQELRQANELSSRKVKGVLEALGFVIKREARHGTLYAYPGVRQRIEIPKHGVVKEYLLRSRWS